MADAVCSWGEEGWSPVWLPQVETMLLVKPGTAERSQHASSSGQLWFEVPRRYPGGNVMTSWPGVARAPEKVLGWYVGS